MINVLFDSEHLDCVPFLFDYLSLHTGKDYSDEKEWVEDCMGRALIGAFLYKLFGD